MFNLYRVKKISEKYQLIFVPVYLALWKKLQRLFEKKNWDISLTTDKNQADKNKYCKKYAVHDSYYSLYTICKK